MENDLDMRSLSIIEHNIVFSISLLPPLATIKKTNIPYTQFNKLYTRTVMQNNTQYPLALCLICCEVRLIPQTKPGVRKQVKLNSLINFNKKQPLYTCKPQRQMQQSFISSLSIKTLNSTYLAPSTLWGKCKYSTYLNCTADAINTKVYCSKKQNFLLNKKKSNVKFYE